MSSQRRRAPPSRLQLNPAFASAHRIPITKDTTNSIADDNNNDDTTTTQQGSSSRTNACARARSTGKLHLANSGLTSSLPDVLFNLRDDPERIHSRNCLSMGDDDGEDNDNKHRPWMCFGEEELTVVDLSDNNLSGMLDERVGSYKSLQTLILKRCNLTDIPWMVLQECCVDLKVLDAQGNGLTVVPLKSLPLTLRELLLSGNEIGGLVQVHAEDDEHSQEEGVITLEALVKLDISENCLTKIPTLCTPRLRHLCLSKNRLTHLPASFLESCVESLESLDVSENQLISNDDAQFQEKEHFDWDLRRHSQLTMLELRRNGLTRIPAIHSELMSLGLSHNSIPSIRAMFGPPTSPSTNHFRSKLTELHLEKNTLSELDSSMIAAMTRLAVLDISLNNLNDLPHVLGYLIDLRKVVLEGNPLRRIRYAIRESAAGGVGCDVRSLKSTLRKKGPPPLGPGYLEDMAGRNKDPAADTNNDVDGNDEMDDAAIRQLVEAATTGSRTLDMREGYQGTLSHSFLLQQLNAKFTLMRSDNQGETVTYGSRIQTLNLSNNRTLSSVLEPYIDAMPNLSTLDLTQNAFKCLPENMLQLPLLVLICARNRITTETLQSTLSMPNNTISNLGGRLTHLDLSYNHIHAIPHILFIQLPNISYLNLSHNQITTLASTPSSTQETTPNLPSSYSKEEEYGWRHGLTTIETLDLSNNQITNVGELPLHLLACCPKLQSLLLSNNNLCRIPNEFGLLAHLTSLQLGGNPQRSVRNSLLEGSCEGLVRYLKGRMDEVHLRHSLDRVEAIRSILEREASVERTLGGNGCARVGSGHSPSLDAGDSESKGGSLNTENAATTSKDKETIRVAATTTDAHSRNNSMDQTSSAKQSPCSESAATSCVDKSKNNNNLLQEQISQLETQLENLSISQAKKFALKKTLAMHRSKLIREERRLKQEEPGGEEILKVPRL